MPESSRSGRYPWVWTMSGRCASRRRRTARRSRRYPRCGTRIGYTDTPPSRSVRMTGFPSGSDLTTVATVTPVPLRWSPSASPTSTLSSPPTPNGPGAAIWTTFRGGPPRSSALPLGLRHAEKPVVPQPTSAESEPARHGELGAISEQPPCLIDRQEHVPSEEAVFCGRGSAPDGAFDAPHEPLRHRAPLIDGHDRLSVAREHPPSGGANRSQGRGANPPGQRVSTVQRWKTDRPAQVVQVLPPREAFFSIHVEGVPRRFVPVERQHNGCNQVVDVEEVAGPLAVRATGKGSAGDESLGEADRPVPTKGSVDDGRSEDRHWKPTVHVASTQELGFDLRVPVWPSGAAEGSVFEQVSLYLPVHFHGAEVNDAVDACLEGCLQHGAGTLHGRVRIPVGAVDHRTDSLHSAADLSGVRHVAEHDFHRETTDADGAAPATNRRSDRRSPQSVQHLHDPPADEASRARNENRLVRGQHRRFPARCLTTAWGSARADHSTPRSWRWRAAPPSPAPPAGILRTPPQESSRSRGLSPGETTEPRAATSACENARRLRAAGSTSSGGLPRRTRRPRTRPERRLHCPPSRRPSIG